MTKPHSYLEIALASIHVFSDDGQLDAGELDKLLDLAMRDRIMDGDERRVLGNIFSQAEQSPLSAEVSAKIAEARRKHGIRI